MIDLALSWEQAAVVAGCLLGVPAAGAPLARRWAPARLLTRGAGFGREAGLLTGLYALWQLVGQHPAASPRAGLARAEWLWHTERAAHLPSEAALQRAALPHPLLVEAANLYYASLHFPVLLGCLAWLYVWHRDEYRRARTTVAAFTACSLLIQFIPVAPPRMLANRGLVDTALEYGQSVYGVGFADQLSAMPSVHVGWALLVAVVVIRVVRSRWRWLALAYPAVTTLVVVVTANHFWLDGIVAAVLLAGVLAAQMAAGPARRSRPSGEKAQPPPGPPAHHRDPAGAGERDPAGQSAQIQGRGSRPYARVPGIHSRASGGNYGCQSSQGGHHDQPGPPVIPSRDL